MVSVDLMFPWTVPSTLTTLASTSASIRPLGPTVSTWSVNSMLPSTWPSQLTLDDHRLPNGRVVLSHGLVPPLISCGECDRSIHSVGAVSRLARLLVRIADASKFLGQLRVQNGQLEIGIEKAIDAI